MTPSRVFMATPRSATISGAAWPQAQTPGSTASVMESRHRVFLSMGFNPLARDRDHSIGLAAKGKPDFCNQPARFFLGKGGSLPVCLKTPSHAAFSQQNADAVGDRSFDRADHGHLQ